MATFTNPKDDIDRLAAAHWYPRNVRGVSTFTPTPFVRVLEEMCDTHSYANRTYLANHARIYRYVYAIDESALVDEWDRAQRPPVGVVFTTTSHLLRWAQATSMRGDVVQRGRTELHEHVKRMDAYLKARLEEM